jgi:small subunit ribosomal protein S9
VSESKDKPVAESQAVAAAPLVTVAEPPEGKRFWHGTGRRKTSVARIRLRPGEGKILINRRQVDQYFTQEKDRNAVRAPLAAANLLDRVDIWVNVTGGGPTGQAGAVLLGIARALRKAAPGAEDALRDGRLLTRDSRMKERKKYGQRGARRRFQFSKR